MQMDKKILVTAVEAWMNQEVFAKEVSVKDVSIEGYGETAVFTFEYNFIGETPPPTIAS